MDPVLLTGTSNAIAHLQSHVGLVIGDSAHAFIL